MDKSKPRRPRISVATVVAADRWRATSRIAGVAAISRVLIEAARAGVTTAWLAVDAPGSLVDIVADDLARGGAEISVKWVSRRPTDLDFADVARGAVLLLSCDAVITASALRRLAEQEDETVLALGSRPLAARLSDRGLPPNLTLAEFDVRQRAAVLEARPEDVILLDSPSAASRQILRQTGKASDGLISRWLNRPISRAISGAVLHIDGVRPGHLTMVTALLGLLMFACLVFGGARGLIFGGLLFQAASIVDGVDGEIARAAFRSSHKGAVLDTAVDMITNLMFVVGVTIGLGRVYGPLFWLIGGADFVMMATGLGLMAVLVRREPGGASFNLVKDFYARRYVTGPIARIFVVLKTLTSRDFFAFAFALLAVVGLSRVIPWAFFAAAVIWLMLVIGATVALLGRSPARSAPPA